MKTRFKLLPILFLIFAASVFTTKAQTIYDTIDDPTKNYYDVVNYYTEYFKTHERGKGTGYKMFKRWEAEMKFWIDEKGNRIDPTHYKAELNKFNSGSVNKTSSATCLANWTELGPTNWNRTSSWSPGLGRVDAIAIHPLNTNVIYVGSPNGGCWKTSNGGVNWSSLTDGQLFMQIGDVEVDPTNLNTVYIGTMGSGMLVSTNGGVTLTPSNTGLPGGINIRKIIVDPTNSANVLIATTSGIYRSTNSGANWTQAIAGSFLDLDFKPGNSSVIYACGTNFYRSTNSGANFTQITSGITASGIMRLAVSPADPNLVCIVQCAGSVFGKFYKSTDGGSNFITTVTGNSANGTNFFGYSPAGTDNSGQGGYNIDVTISPTDANEIHLAGIITWKSVDGGNNWVSTTEWTYPNARGYTHCDVHALEYIGNKLFVGSDGGISISTDMGDNFTSISSGLGIRMFYRMGGAATNSITIATGAQDNGGSVRTATGWIDWIGADGMEAAVDHTNANIIYGSSQNGTFYKTTNGGTTYSGLTTPSTAGNWTTPFVIDPNMNTTLYVGYNELYKSTNSGGTWTQISTIGIGDLDHIAVAPSNSNYIYISSGNTIYRTTNGGANWTNISTGLGGSTINGIAVHNSSPDKVAIATSGSKIYTSTTGGVAWTNSTGNFPAVSARCLVYQNDASAGLYVGTNTGVYYKDNTMVNWIPFAAGLPIVGVNELEIHYGSNKIRAATYGRGIWESDICRDVALDISITNIIEPLNASTYCNNSIIPKITLSNTGTVTVTSAVIMYKMDATATQTLNWSGSLSASASTVITLNTYSGLTVSAHTFSVWASSPNSGVDQDASNNSQVSTFTIMSTPVGAPLPFTEGFENATFPPTNWLLQKSNTIDPAVSWTRVLNSTGLTAGSTAVARMDNYSSASDISGQIDALRSPALTFTGANASLNLSFDVSHKNYSTTDIDTLNVKISTDCGITWSQLYTKGGTQLSTSTGTQSSAFTPTANAQWRRETVSLTAYAGFPSVYLKFESRSGWGNHVYLDNINISYTASAIPTANFTNNSINCSGTSITFTDQSTSAPTSWAWTFPGGTPSSSIVQNSSITYAAGGTYTVTLQSANANGTSTPVTKTITVNATPTVAISNATICSGVSANLIASGANTYSWSTGAGTASISVTPTVSTNYTVTGTNTVGCANSKTVSVTVNATPTVAISNATVCSGVTASLLASGANTYSWSTGASTASISVTPTTTTNYTVIGTNTLSCSNTKIVSVTVNTTPTVAVNNATVCSGNPVTLTASGATSYNWNTGATTSSISVTPTVATNYIVTGTTNGCTNTKTVSVAVNTTPIANAGTAGTITCTSPTLTLNGSGVTTYTWSGPGIVSGGNAASPVVNAAGTYTLIGSTSGCTSALTTVAVITNTITPSTTSSVSGTITCNTPTVTAIISTTTSPVTFNWNGAGIITGATTSTITVNQGGTFNYTVTNTNNGCIKTGSLAVTINTVTPTVSVSSATICSGATATLVASGSAASYSWSNGATGSNLMVSPAGNTTYTVTAMATNGCINTASANVVVGGAPVITVNSVTICSGSTATLTASGVTTYTWNTSSNATSIIVNPISTTVYTVSGILTGCAVTAVNTATVIVNATPTVTLGTITSPLCITNSTVALTGNPGGGVYSGVGVAGPMFDPSIAGAGTFTITYNYTDVNNCSNSANQSVVVDLCTNILEISGSFISVFPNPIKNEITINLDNELINETIIDLFDALGKLVLSEKMENKTNTFQVTHLANGIYSLRVTSKNIQKSLSIIKE